MIRDVRAIFNLTNDPLGPTKTIECQVNIDDESGKIVNWIFPKGTDMTDILFFMEYTSDSKCRMDIMGYE